MKTLIALIILVLIGWATYALVFKTKPATDSLMESSADNTTAPANQMTETTSAPAQVSSVDIKNFAFSPSTLTIKKGTKVTWTNADSVPHTVTSDSGTTLNSARLANGGSFSFTFDTAGTYDYHCSVHPSMKGKVIVTE